MEPDKRKESDEPQKDNANIRQTNQQQKKEGSQINLGGREFTGDLTDQETSSTGLPTMDPDTPLHSQERKGSETKKKS
jgi:hypothetical protein